MKNPLHYQLSGYDCGPTSLLNGIAYLFEREEIPPEVVRNIMLYCLDQYGPDCTPGKSGTSAAAMMFLCNWLTGYGRLGRFPVSARYLSGEQVCLGPTSQISDALYRGGVAVVRVWLDGGHYVLLTGERGGQVTLFDPWYFEGPMPDPAVRVLLDHPDRCNRTAPARLFDREGDTLYAFGPVEKREAVLLFNERTRLTPEQTVEYMI